MRILIVTCFFPPLNSIASLRPYSWAKYWTEAGHEVTVATPPYIPNPKIDLDLSPSGCIHIEIPYLFSSLKSHYQVESNDKNIITRLKKIAFAPFEFIRNNYGSFNATRMPDITDFWIAPAVNRLSQEKPWDLVVSTAGPYTVHFVAEELKRNQKAACWIADFRDLWADNHIYSGLFPINLFEGWIEKRILRRADHITVVSKTWADILAKRHGKERLHVIENGFEPEDFKLLPKEHSFPSDGKFRLVHTGVVYKGKQNVELLFEALSLLRQKRGDLSNLEVIFVGQQLEYIDSLTKQYQLENIVKVQGRVARNIAMAMQRDAHGLLFFAWTFPGSGNGLITGKIYEYLYSRRPIWVIGEREDQEAVHLLQKSGAATFLPSAEKISSFFEEKLINLQIEQTKTSELFLSSFHRKVLAQKLLELKK